MSRPTDACQGPCNNLVHRAWNAYDQALVAWFRAVQEAANKAEPAPPKPEEPADIPYRHGDPTWCKRCTSMIRLQVAELDDLASQLGALADGHRGAPAEEKLGKKGKGASSPSVSPIVDQLDELYGWLTSIEDAWRHVRSWPPRPQRARKDTPEHRDAAARIRCLSWLSVHLDAILAHPGSVRFGYGVAIWHRRMQAATKTQPVEARLPGRCPRCEWEALRRWTDDEHVKCSNCGMLYAWSQYMEMRDQQAGGTPVVGEKVAG